MIKLYQLMLVWGPGLIGFALGWLVRHPRDWSGPAVVALLGCLLTWATYRWGLRQRRLFTAGMIAGGAVGPLIFAMLALGVIG